MTKTAKVQAHNICIDLSLPNVMFAMIKTLWQLQKLGRFLGH